jgi:hypothetical protein
VRDSADINIVENAPLPDTMSQWWLDPQPVLRIGGDESSAAQYLFQRISGATQLASGELLVLDAGVPVVRIFDSTGIYVRDLVRKGGGPGELYYMASLHRTRADSIYVYNGEGDQLLVFAPDLTVSRAQRPTTFTADSTDKNRSLGMRLVFDDGTLLSALSSADPLKPALDKPGQPAAPFVDSSLWARGTGGERMVSRFGWFVGKRGSYLVERQFSYALYTHFQPGGVYTVRGTDFFFADGAHFDIHVYDGATGQLRRRIRLKHAPVSLSSADAQRIRDIPNIPPPPEHYPALDALHVDFDGNIWARSWRTVDSGVERVWFVFDSTGVLQQSVQDQAGFIVHEIGREYILGVARDEFDTPFVIKYRLHKD